MYQLYSFIAHDKSDAIRELVLNGRISLESIRSNENHALANALVHKRIEIAHFLIQQCLTKEDVHQAIRRVILYAVLNRNAEVLELLLEFGMTVETIRMDNNHILHLAYYYDNWQVIEFLVRQGLDETDISEAIPDLKAQERAMSLINVGAATKSAAAK